MNRIPQRMVRKEGVWNPFANKRDRKFSRDRGASQTEGEERDWARERIQQKQQRRRVRRQRTQD